MLFAFPFLSEAAEQCSSPLINFPRGGLIPASLPDWRGALLSGVIFGLLHNSGGRNLAFAAWASAVGVFYGGLYVSTHDIWVPIAAHSLANFSSAAIWKHASDGIAAGDAKERVVGKAKSF